MHPFDVRCAGACRESLSVVPARRAISDAWIRCSTFESTSDRQFTKRLLLRTCGLSRSNNSSNRKKPDIEVESKADLPGEKSVRNPRWIDRSHEDLELGGILYNFADRLSDDPKATPRATPVASPIATFSSATPTATPMPAPIAAPTADPAARPSNFFCDPVTVAPARNATTGLVGPY
jgi:hypothetical protein